MNRRFPFIYRTIDSRAKLAKKVLLFLVFVTLGIWFIERMLFLSFNSALTRIFVAAAAIVVWLQPVIGLLILLISTSTVFPLGFLPQPITFGDYGLVVAEILCIFLALIIFVKVFVRKDLWKLQSALTIPMGLLCVWIVLSVLNAICLHNVSPYDSLMSAKGYIYYLNFFLVLYFIDSERKLKLFLNSMLWISVLFAVMTILQFALGPTVRLLPLSSTWTVSPMMRGYSEPTLARVTPLCLSLIYLAFFPVFALITSGHTGNKWYKFVVVLLGGALFVSFTRNVYFSVLFGLLLICFIFKEKKTKKRVVKYGIIGISSIIILIYLISFLGGVKGTSFWQQAISRPAEVFQVGLFNVPNWKSRMEESKIVLSYILNSPTFGNGIGASYYNPLVAAYRTGCHNGYLSIVFQMGIVGLAIFLWIFYRYIKRGLWIYNQIENTYYKMWVLGLTVAFIALLPAIFVKPVLVGEFFWISLLSVTWSLNEVIFRVSQKKKCTNLAWRTK